MAKKAASVDADVLDEGEVPLSSVKPAQEKGLDNGLGLEKLFPATKSTPKPAKSEPADGETDEAVESDSKPDEKQPTKKPAPPKDPKTGRFLKAKTAESEPPLEDAQPDDDPSALRKRLKDTRDWASQVNKKNHDLAQQVNKLTADMDVLNQKLAGTYQEPDKDKIDPVKLAKLTERTKLSRSLAEQIYGPELVQQLIYDEDAPYRQLEQMDPFVKARVFESDQPVMEAIRQLKWKNFHDQYGLDPDEATEKLRDEVRAEFVSELKKKNAAGKRTIDDVGGLSNVDGEHHDTKKPAVKEINLRNVFTNFPTGSF